jgi:hypothetical protein
MAGQSKEERRRRSAKVLVAGSALTGSAALGNYALDRGMDKGPGRLVESTLKGKLRPVHGAYAAGKMGVFATRMTGIPLMAAGAYGIAKPKQNVREFNIKRDVVKPVTNHLTLRQDAAVARARQVMEKADAAPDLTAREQKALIARKRRGRTLSEIGGTLGVTALTLRTPELAGIAARRIPSVGRNKTVTRFAAREMGATRASNTIGVGAIGTGAIGSFNYAGQQRLETKQQAATRRRQNEQDRVMVNNPAVQKSDAFLRNHSQNISPSAERGYKDLAGMRNREAVMTTGNAVLGGVVGADAIRRFRRKDKMGTAVMGTWSAVQGLQTAYNATNAKRLQGRMNKIKAKGMERAAEGKLGPERVGKSYVGGGAYRSLASLSPQARKVVRRNLETNRTLRKMPGARPSSFGSSPQQRAADRMRAMEGGKDESPMGQAMAQVKARPDVKSRPTRVKNMHVSEGTSPSTQQMLERTFSGRKLRNKVTVDATDGDISLGQMKMGGYATEAKGGGGRDKLVSLQRSSQGYNPRMAMHEMQHAQASGRKGRLTSLGLRKNPRRSIQREEAAADAASFRPKDRRVKSGYADMWGDQSTYGRELKRRLGFQPRHQSLRANMKEGEAAASAAMGSKLSGADRPKARAMMAPQIRELLPKMKERGLAGVGMKNPMDGTRQQVRNATYEGARMRAQNRRDFFSKRAPQRHEVEAGVLGTAGAAGMLAGAGNKKIMERIANGRIFTAERTNAKRLKELGVPKSNEKAKKASIDAANRQKKNTIARVLRDTGGRNLKLMRVGGLVGGGALLYGAAQRGVGKADSKDVDAAAAGAVLGGGVYQGLGYAGKVVDRRLDAAAAKNPKSSAALRAHRELIMPGRGRTSSKQNLSYHRTYPKDVPGWQWKRLRSYTHAGAIGNTLTVGAAAAGAAGAVKIKRDREVGKSIISAAKDSHSLLHGALVPIGTAAAIGGGTLAVGTAAQKARRKKVRKDDVTPEQRKAAKQAAYEAKQAKMNSPEAQAARARAQATGAADQRRAAQSAPRPKVAAPSAAPAKRAFIAPAQVSTMATHAGITGGGLVALKHRHEQRKRGEKPKGGIAGDAAIGAATAWSGQDLAMVGGGFATKRGVQAYRDYKMKNPETRKMVNREWKGFQEREGFKQFGEKHPSDKPGLDMRTTRDQVKVGSRYPTKIPGGRIMRALAWKNHPAVTTPLALGAAAAGGALAVRHARKQEVGKDVAGPLPGSHSVARGVLTPIAVTGAIGGGTYLALVGAKKARRKVRKSYSVPDKGKASVPTPISTWDAESKGRLKTKLQNAKQFRTQNPKKDKGKIPLEQRGNRPRSGTREGAAAAHRAARIQSRHAEAIAENAARSAPAKRAFTNPTQLGMWGSGGALTGGGLVALKHRSNQRKRGEKPAGGVAADAAIGAATGWNAQNVANSAGGWALKRGTQAYREHKMKDPKVRATANREWSAFQRREGFKQFGEKHSSDRPGLDMRTPEAQVNVGRRYPTKIPGGRAMRALAWQNHPSVAVPMGVAATVAGGALAARHARKQPVDKAMLRIPKVNYARRIGAGLMTRRPRSGGIRRATSGKISTFRGSVR